MLKYQEKSFINSFSLVLFTSDIVKELSDFMNCRVVVLYGNVNLKSQSYFFIKESFEKVKGVQVVEYVNEIIDFASLCKKMKEMSLGKALFVSADVYGPVKELEPMLQAFDKHDEDVVGLISQPPFSEGVDELFSQGVSIDCFSLNYRVLTDSDIAEIFNRLISHGKQRFRFVEEDNPLSTLEQRGYTIGGVINKDNFEDFVIDAGYDYIKNKSFELISNTVCPFIFKRRFEADNNLTDDLNRAIDYIRDNTEYNIDLMLEDVATTINPLDSKRNLNLNYIIPYKFPIYDYLDETIYSKTAIFAHIYYEDRIENCFEYLQKIPIAIHKYITTSNPVSYEIMSKRIQGFDESWNLRLVKNHGRDISALWVEDAPLLKNYEYVCYVHDKKTSGQKGNILNGDYYHYNVWENTLKNDVYINNILHTLYENKRLGFLSPPFPIFFDYKGLLGYEWTICYEPTIELAKDLNINANIDKTKPPFAFSNTFWAKTDALLPLINRKLQYIDFPEEPLPIDGSISHAIERIYIYVAQSQGYLSGIMEHSDYASMELNSMQKIMADKNVKLNEMWAERDRQARRADKLQRERDICREAIDNAFINISAAKRKIILSMPEGKLYVFGSGKIGKRIARQLKDNGCNVTAFLVSDGQDKEQKVDGINCYHFSDVQLTKDDNLVIALNQSNYEQVRELLSNVQNKVLYSDIIF